MAVKRKAVSISEAAFLYAFAKNLKPANADSIAVFLNPYRKYMKNLKFLCDFMCKLKKSGVHNSIGILKFLHDYENDKSESEAFAMDVVLLSRLQFGLTTVYHFFFVPLTIGLTVMVALMESIYAKNGNEDYKKMAKLGDPQ